MIRFLQESFCIGECQLCILRDEFGQNLILLYQIPFLKEDFFDNAIRQSGDMDGPGIGFNPSGRLEEHFRA